MPLNPNEVKTEHIANGAVTTPKIADEQITAAKLKNSAVTTEKLAAGAITISKIGEAQVTGSKLRDSAVRTEKIAAGAVTTSKIGELQVTTSRIQDKGITAEKLASGAVTTEKIANGAVTPAKLSFTPPSIARPITPPVSTDEIANGAITTPKITDGAVTPAKLSFSVLTRPLTPPVATDELADASVTPVKLDAIDTPSDGEVPTYNQAQDKFEWKPSGGAVEGLFVPRRVTTWDFNQTNFTRDGTWYLDGLDLSALVPANVKAVLLRVYGVANVAGHSFKIRTNDTDASANEARLEMKVAGGGAECGQFVLPVDADRKLDYYAMSGFYSMQVHVVGWFV